MPYRNSSSAPPRQDRATILSTRELALSALDEIWSIGSKPKHVIEQLSDSLDNRDRSFLMELVYGVLRYRDTLDWAMRAFLRKPSGLSPDTLNNLRLAVYQILFLRVPERAAVHEAVEMEKRGGRPELVNAVLRNLLRVPPPERLNLETIRKKGAVPYIALRTSHPKWLIKRWIRRFGEEETLALAEANNKVPPLTLRVNTLKSGREEMIKRLSEEGIQGEATRVSPDGITLSGFRTFRELSAFRDSLTVQDEGAQLISYLLDPAPGERILDACAAPGGKSTHMAQLMKDEGEIVAVDADEGRLRLLRENASALGMKSIRAVCADIVDYTSDTPFDRVLLDAPCSSLGVIRRNPDVRYRHTVPDLSVFKAKQLRLLRSIARCLGPGGVLVYSVCSTEPEEGEEVIKEFLKDSGDSFIIDTAPAFPGGLMKDGFLRTYPHINNMDGFFGVRLCRKA